MSKITVNVDDESVEIDLDLSQEEQAVLFRSMVVKALKAAMEYEEQHEEEE